MANYRYTAVLYAFGYDEYRNPISHYQLFDRKQLIAESGRTRKHTGHAQERAVSVLRYLTELKERKYDPVLLAGSVEQGCINVGFKQVRTKYTKRKSHG